MSLCDVVWWSVCPSVAGPLPSISSFSNTVSGERCAAAELSGVKVSDKYQT